MSTSKELTIQIVAALAAAGLIAWYSSRKNSAAVPWNEKVSPNQGASIDDGSPGGFDVLSVNYGVSGESGSIPIAVAPISAYNLPATVPTSGRVPQQNLQNVLNIGIPTPRPGFDFSPYAAVTTNDGTAPGGSPGLDVDALGGYG